MFNFDIYRILLLLPWVLLALSFHEFCHGYVSYKLGDPTPKYDGRLSLNPLAHLDLFGFIAMVLTGFGWAKPVMINPNYYKNPMKGTLWVSLAGPGANFTLAILFGGIFRLLNLSGLNQSLNALFAPLGLGNSFFMAYLYLGIIINISLGVFNLIPIPPLDGSKILRYFLKGQAGYFYDQYEQFGFVLLLLVLFSGATNSFLNWIVNLLGYFLVQFGQ